MSEPDLTRWPTPAGALTSYEQYWTPTTDAPREYIVTCALVVTATILANRVYLPFGGDKIFANLWIILLGPSSAYRKTTNVKQARRTLTRMSEGQPHAYLFPDEFSKEALVGRLQDQAQGLLTYSEFSGALAAMSRDYMGGTKELLADLYDSPPKYERIVGGRTITAKDVCIGILAASQTDWLLEKLKETDIRGGFMARFLFVPAFTKRRFLAIPPDPDIQIGNTLSKQLRALQHLEGPISLPTSVRDRYASWLESHERELEALPRAGQMGPFWSRLGITTFKVAMIISVSSTNTLVMTDEALESAIAFTTFIKASLAHLFEEEIAFTPEMKHRQKVLQAVRRHPGILYRDLMRSCSLSKRQVDAVLETVLAEEVIVEQREQRVRQFWPVSPSATVSDVTTDTKRPAITRVK